MAFAEFVGDEVTAAAYGLCGIATHLATEADVSRLIDNACRNSSLLLIDSLTAMNIAPDRLDELMSRSDTSVLIVPSLRGGQQVPDISYRIYKQLGILE